MKTKNPRPFVSFKDSFLSWVFLVVVYFFVPVGFLCQCAKLGFERGSASVDGFRERIRDWRKEAEKARPEFFQE